MKKKVLLLGASGLIAPNLLEGLQPYYDLHLVDVKAHPDGREVDQCDVSDYGQVLAAAEGMHAIMNFTVIRDDAERSFHVNTRGALNVMKAAVAHGIKKVIHSGPQFVRRTYDHDFDVADVPPVLGTGYYCLTKGLASEICRAYARAYDMQIFLPLPWCGRICSSPAAWPWKSKRCPTASRNSICSVGKDTGNTMSTRPGVCSVSNRQKIGDAILRANLRACCVRLFNVFTREQICEEL
jgi:hypothetical protein